MNDTFERLQEFYERGALPWDQELPPPEVIAALESLTAGRALDLGCGVGRAARYMAARGWHVDAIDFVPKAIELARERSADFSTITYHTASVTDLHFLHPPYDFALDVGCGHSLEGEQLRTYADQLARLLTPNGLFLFFGRIREPLREEENRPRGVHENELFAAFERAFRLEKMERGETDVRGEVWPSAWYWWRRRAESAAEETQTAVERERLRIARDMHDTISQSLFGIAYGLNGCQKLVPEGLETLRAELAALEQEAQKVRQELRHVIFDLWPNELTGEGFSADLHRYLNDLTDQPIELELDINGDFAPIAPFVRRTLYRICQESLANIVHHAAADHARVCLDIANERVRLLVRDNGIGFNPATAYGDKFVAEHFGLRGMEERAHALGGTFDVFSRPQEGTSIVVDIPIQ